MIRITMIVVVALLVAMTGCIATGASLQSPSPRQSATPTAANATPTGTNETGSFPPGASAMGIDNASKLVETHEAALNETSYVERSTWERVGHRRGSDGTFGGFRVRQLAVTVEQDANDSRVRIAGENVSQDYWLVEKGFFRNDSRLDGNVSSKFYEYRHNVPYYQPEFDRYLVTLASGILDSYLRDLDYEHVRTVSRDGRTLHTYASTGINETVEPNIGDTPVKSTTENITATVVVSDRGIIHSFTARETHALENETATAEQRYAVDGLGATDATAPEWVTEEIARFDVSLAGNGTVLALTHAGGRTATDPVLFLHTPDSSRSTHVDGTVAAGDTIYVYLTEDDDANRTLHTSVNEPPAVNGSFVPLPGGNRSITVFRYLLDSHDSGIQVEATVQERPGDSGSNATRTAAVREAPQAAAFSVG